MTGAITKAIEAFDDIISDLDNDGYCTIKNGTMLAKNIREHYADLKALKEAVPTKEPETLKELAYRNVYCYKLLSEAVED